MSFQLNSTSYTLALISLSKQIWFGSDSKVSLYLYYIVLINSSYHNESMKSTEILVYPLGGRIIPFPMITLILAITDIWYGGILFHKQVWQWRLIAHKGDAPFTIRFSASNSMGLRHSELSHTQSSNQRLVRNTW